MGLWCGGCSVFVSVDKAAERSSFISTHLPLILSLLFGGWWWWLTLGFWLAQTQEQQLYT